MQKYFNYIIDTEGRPVSGMSVAVIDSNGNADIYSDDGVTSALNPITTGDDGFFEFYAADGKYDLTFSSANTETVTVTDVRLFDPDDALTGADAADGEILVGSGTGFVLESGATVLTSLGAQAQGDVLDDLNTLGAVASDGQIIVGTAAGVFAYESGATALTSLGAQAQGDVLDDLNTLGAAAADGEFLVADGAGSFAYESGHDAITSLGIDYPVSVTTGATFNVNDLAYAFTTQRITLGTSVSVVISSNAVTAYPVGTEIYFVQGGAGEITFSISTDTLNWNANLTAVTNGQYAVAGIKKVTTTEWILFGNLVPA